MLVANTLIVYDIPASNPPIVVDVPLISVIVFEPEYGCAVTVYLDTEPLEGALKETSIVASVMVAVFIYKSLGGGNMVL